MRKRTVAIAAGTVLGVAAVSGGIAYASGVGSDPEQPITGAALERASSAALAHTGGGRVTGTEVGDEESLYEVEVTLADGRQVDVQLDAGFRVVGKSDLRAEAVARPCRRPLRDPPDDWLRDAPAQVHDAARHVLRPDRARGRAPATLDADNLR